MMRWTPSTCSYWPSRTGYSTRFTRYWI